jgi:transcription elongation factor Elf1
MFMRRTTHDHQMVTIQCPMCLTRISRSVGQVRDQEVSCKVCSTSFAVEITEASARWARFKAAISQRKARVA